MLRINSRDVLVVPPFECAWLSLSDYGVEGGCCLSFEHKGDNDVTVIFKAVAGGKRWQPLARRAAGDALGDAAGGGAGGGGIGLAVEDNYTVILGSHRNSCLKFEKNGETVAQVQGVPGSRVGSREFTPMWIDCRGGAITVGAGPPGANVAHRWVDPEPGELAQAIRHAGLSCWDRHVSYRNVRVLPPLDPQQLEAAVTAAADAAAAAASADADAAASPEQQQQQQSVNANVSPPRGSLSCAACGAPTGTKGAAAAAAAAAVSPVRSCFDSASDSIIAALSPAFVCRALQVTELLLPASDRAYRAAVEYLGGRFEECAAKVGREMALLSAPALADVLTEPLLSVPEYLIFEVVASWACYGQPPPSPAAGAGPSGPNFRSSSSGGGGEAGSSKSRRPSGGSRPGTNGGAAEAEEGAAVTADVAGGEAYRPASELALVVPLVRFVLMGADDMAAVRSHPFVRRHPLVRQLIEGELAAAAEGAAAPGGGLTVFDRRRIVRPVGADAHRQHQQQQQQQQQQQPMVGSPPGALHQQQQHPHPQPQHQPHLCTADGCRAGPPGQSPPHGGSAAAGFPSSRYHRRLAPSCTELMFVHDGDRNGAIAHIATDYGTTAWVNPVLARRVEVRASSPASRFTDPKAIVGGTPPRTSFACPRWEAGAPSTWWLVDLGPSHRLLCNYYTMRHDSSSDFARHWVLQASNDLRHWVDLRRHISDTSIRLPGQIASWPVSGPAAHLPFRAFRLLLAGPTLSATTPWNFCVAGVEFYGYFFRVPAPAGGGAGAGGGTDASAAPPVAPAAGAASPAAAAAVPAERAEAPGEAATGGGATGAPAAAPQVAGA